ncbi:hypothetical protein MUK70_15835 [Dyadobacter chenwenxiniae]|uniref:Uncharacterized protein n=1 Tax=Dyadobacter chenwenxiniae TaxID=2906456 RepID=A0A9X1PG35_9BACT|nr:hypothetical protein [Dyadobacter chenwenxiniae]MCF0060712.1 hypothetical protein [Dyadobacter chenwenxiniae]UON80546.1 hypothetical protein MUK70_15835 [Dyadobacter chenwenxiniae]
MNNRLYQFPVDSQGVPYTYTLGSIPYMEASSGVSNFFKFFRVDAVRRFNYLNHPNVSPWEIRMKATFDF